MTEQITLFAGSSLAQTVSLVPVPTVIGPNNIQFQIQDTVGINTSPFTFQTQRQQTPGADLITAKVTLPPLYPREAAMFKAWLMEMRGMACAMQIGDPDAQRPQGFASAETGTPVVDTSVSTNNLAMTQLLMVRGFKPGLPRLLLPGDALQMGYRMHYAVNPVGSDVNGNATIKIWPSLREQPPDGTPLQLNHPMVLMSLDSNDRGWTRGVDGYTEISFGLMEWR